MLKFRNFSATSAASLLARAAAAPPRAQFSTGSRQEYGTFYEFRTYCIRPEQNAAFLQLTNEKIHLRTAHSQLIGYWSVEYGGLNQVFHVWKYDSFRQRSGVRSALAQDASWVSQYLSRAIPMLTSQHNEVTYLLPWSRLQAPPQEGGVYELVSFQMRPGGLKLWGGALQAAITSQEAAGCGALVGVFLSVIGRIDQVHALWWFESADRRATVRDEAGWDAAGNSPFPWQYDPAPSTGPPQLVRLQRWKLIGRNVRTRGTTVFCSEALKH